MTRHLSWEASLSFFLYDEFGFPMDMSDFMVEEGLKVDVYGFFQERQHKRSVLARLVASQPR